MRIGVNTLFLVPGDVGGTEIYLRRNLEQMAAQFPEQTLVVFTSRDNQAILRADLEKFANVEFLLVPVTAGIRPLRIVAEQLLLPLQARRADVDVLWSPGYTAPFFSPCPQAVTIHDLQYLSFPEDITWLERWTLDLLVRTACRRCRRVITISNFSRGEIVRHGFAASEKISVVHEGVDPVFGRPATAGLSGRGPAPLPAGAPYILCVAHTYPHKKVDLLIEAFRLLEGQIPHHLVLVGKARRGERAVAASLAGVRDQSRVHRYPRLEFPALVETFQRADLFVLPSVYEGFGLPILEAMMAGTPVVTTASASLPEVGGDQAIYAGEVSGAGIGSAILEVLALPANRRQELCRRAKLRAEGFSWQASAAATMQALLSAATSRG